MIWFHHTDWMGDHFEYSVTDWEAARDEATRIIQTGLGYVPPAEQAVINGFLESDQWQSAVAVYNATNAVKEFLLFREGKRVYEP